MHIPRANLILRPYSEIMRSGGSYAYFTQMCGAGFPDGMVPVCEQNPNLPNALMEIARLANRQLSISAAQAVFQSLQRANEYITIPKNSDIEMFGTDNRQHILEFFKSVHTYLNVISGRASFLPTMPKLPSAIRPPNQWRGGMPSASLMPIFWQSSLPKTPQTSFWIYAKKQQVKAA